MLLRPLVAAVAAATVLILALPSRGASYPKPPRQLAKVIHATWRGHGEQTATCLAWFESRYDTLNVLDGHSWSSSWDSGLWQVNYSAHHRPGESPASFRQRLGAWWANARAAFSLSSGGSSWWAWTGTYGRGLCHGLN